MILTTSSFLTVLALVLLLLAGFKVPEKPWFSLGWFGVFFWLLASFIKK